MSWLASWLVGLIVVAARTLQHLHCLATYHHHVPTKPSGKGTAPTPPHRLDAHDDIIHKLAPFSVPFSNLSICQSPSPAHLLSLQKLGKALSDIESSLKKKNDRLMLLTSKGSSLSDIEEVSLQLAALQEEYEQKEERWLELAEIAGDL